MRNEQWIFYKNFSVSGKIKNLWKRNLIHYGLNFLEDIHVKFRETELIEMS